MVKNKIELYEIKDQNVNAAVNKIVVEIFNKRKTENHKGQVILLTGASPLAGTTSTAINLAIAAASTGSQVLLVDGDVRKAEKYKRLNEKTDMGLADYLLQDMYKCGNDSLQPSQILYETNIENLQYVPCGSYNTTPQRVLCSRRMAQFTEAMQAQFDYVICDLPSISLVPDAEVLFPLSDGIILVTALDETRKQSLKIAKNKIRPYVDRYYGMIINKIPQDVYRKAAKGFDYYLSDVKGGQKLGRNTPYREYEKKRRAEERAASKKREAEERKK